MNADDHDNMQRIATITLDDWKATVTAHEAYLWWHDLEMLIRRTHCEIDQADVMFGDGDLRWRVEQLRARMETAEGEVDRLQAIVAKTLVLPTT